MSDLLSGPVQSNPLLPGRTGRWRSPPLTRPCRQAPRTWTPAGRQRSRPRARAVQDLEELFSFKLENTQFAILPLKVEILAWPTASQHNFVLLEPVLHSSSSTSNISAISGATTTTSLRPSLLVARPQGPLLNRPEGLGTCVDEKS